MGRLIRKRPAQQVPKRRKASIDENETFPRTENSAELASAGVSRGISDVAGAEKPVFRSVNQSASDKTQQDSPLAKSLQFLREVETELKKVTWPTRKQTAASTVVVIVLVIIFSVFLGLVDAGLSGIIRFILGR